MSSEVMNQIRQTIDDEVNSKPSAFEFEMAYQARTAIDRIKFAIKHTEQFGPHTDQMWEASIHFQVTLQDPVCFGVHTSDRMAAISEGLFVDITKGRDQSLGSFGLIGVWPFDRWTKSNGSFELNVHDG